MVLNILTYIFFAWGAAVILYAFGALLSWMNHERALKGLADEHQPGSDMPTASARSVADVFWKRAKILLQNKRLDDALADCKRVLEINPGHAAARRVWKHLVHLSLSDNTGEFLVGEAGNTSSRDEEVGRGPKPGKAESTAPVAVPGESGSEEDTSRP